MHKVYKFLYKPIRIFSLPIKFFSVVIMLLGIVIFVLRKPLLVIPIGIISIITAVILRAESEVATIYNFILKTDEKR